MRFKYIWQQTTAASSSMPTATAWPSLYTTTVKQRTLRNMSINSYLKV